MNNLSELIKFLPNIDSLKENIINEYDINTLLEITLTANQVDFPNNPFEKQQAELIAFAINNGATYLFDIRRNFNSVPLKTLEYLKSLVVDNTFPSKFFLKQVVISYKYDSNYKLSYREKDNLFYDLVKFSIDHNADVNTIIIGTSPILNYVENSKVYKYLEDNGAKCSLFVQKLKKIIDTIDLTEYNIKDFPKELHKSLVSTKKTYIEMPKLLHHIWLSNNSKDISSNDLNNLLKTKDFFATQMQGNWKQVVWVNNKDLIPNSINFLENNNIEVRSIDDLENNIRLFNQIKDLISQDKLVMASDFLRYSLIEYLGGVYADLNYLFLNQFNYEVNQYDFFSNSLINSFFMAKPNHPIVKAEISFLEKFINDEFVDLLWLKDHANTKEQTMLTTAYTFAYNIIKYINTDNNIDFVTPNNNPASFDTFTCNINMEAFSYANLMEYCSNPLTVSGTDYHSDWIS